MRGTPRRMRCRVRSSRPSRRAQRPLARMLRERYECRTTPRPHAARRRGPGRTDAIRTRERGNRGSDSLARLRRLVQGGSGGQGMARRSGAGLSNVGSMRAERIGERRACPCGASGLSAHMDTVCLREPRHVTRAGALRGPGIADNAAAAGCGGRTRAGKQPGRTDQRRLPSSGRGERGRDCTGRALFAGRRARVDRFVAVAAAVMA